MKTNTALLIPDTFYHIYNRGINGETIFREKRNYAYFLTKYSRFVSPVVDTYAYCLLANHFHVLVKRKREQDIMDIQKEAIHNKTGHGATNPELVESKLKSPEWYISNSFAQLFKSYAQTINNTYGRTGGLFEEPFRRSEVVSEKYLTHLVIYIHCNPQKHSFVDDFKAYPHSSYNSLLSNEPTKLKREEVLDWFGSKENFVAFHEYEKDGILKGRHP